MKLLFPAPFAPFAPINKVTGPSVTSVDAIDLKPSTSIRSTTCVIPTNLSAPGNESADRQPPPRTPETPPQRRDRPRGHGPRLDGVSVVKPTRWVRA